MKPQRTEFAFPLRRGQVELKARFFLVLIGFLIFNGAMGQRGYDWRTNIDLIVEQTDSLSMKSQETFYLIKYLKDKSIRETWHYTLKEGKIIIFQVRYLIDSTEYAEIYYMNNGNLICMEQYESEDFFTYDDEIKRGKVFFFDGNSLKQYVTVGNDKMYNSHWNRQAEALQYFNKRYSELKRNKW